MITVTVTVTVKQKKCTANRAVRLLLVLVALISAAHAQHKDAGVAAFQFLNMDYDARSVAMAGAACAMPNGIYGVLSNPAAAGYTDRMAIMGGYRQIIMDVWGGPLGISLPLRKSGAVLTPHLLTLTSGRLDVVDEYGMETGRSAGSVYTALGVSAAKVFNNEISAGVTVKGIYHNISDGEKSYSAEGLALDAGVQYRANGNRLIYGVALRNAGFMRGYWDEWGEYGMPYGVEAGVSYIPRHIPELRVAIDINKYNGDYANFEPAFEYSIIKNTLFVRGGYAFSSVDFETMLGVFKGDRDETYQKSSANSLSLGAGLATAMDNVEMKMDAAVQFYSDISAPALVITLFIGF